MRSSNRNTPPPHTSQKPKTVKNKGNRPFTAVLSEWDHDKGFGYLKHQKRKLFLHRRDFSQLHKRPKKGDKLHYRLGTDKQGRTCAVKARHIKDDGRIKPFSWLMLALLLLLPLLALNKLAVLHSTSPLHSAGALLVLALLNLLTYRAYAKDKRLACAQEWRTPESSLHLLSILGGWPAAFIAQRKLRHKISKAKFLRTFWLTPLAHILLALAYLLDWHLIHGIPR